MRTSKIALGSLLLLLILLSCNKQKEVLVPDNTLPPDGTISNIVVESYVNRAYISLLGRKAEPDEFESAEVVLRADNLSQANREAFLGTLIGTNEYYDNLFEVGRALYLNSIDTVDIQDQIFLFNLLLQDPQYQDIYPVLNDEISRMQLVLDIPTDLKNGSIDEVEMHNRLIYNYVYDQINMGTQNFVISMFQNFLFRYPTGEELANSELMVNGFPSQIFLESGRSKLDFMRIFFESGDYYEGQVRDVFSRYLFREPDTEEMETLSNQYEDTGNYEDLLETVLSTDEYIGL